MLLRLSLLFTVLFFSCFTISAQQKCGTDEYHLEKMSDQDYQVKYDAFNTAVWSASARQRNARTQRNSTVYTIPVVFHVMHKGEPEGSGVNISDETIRAALKELNERFRKIPGSIGDGNSVDMEYQFALAVRDPDGNCTDGINRVDMTSYPDYMDYGQASPGMSEVDLKALSYWDSKVYCNIWVVSHIQDYGGYSTFPHNHGEPWDGVVITYNLVGYTDYPALTHELGHYLGLEHVFHWGNETVCPPNDDCLNQGDGVCDTPPQLQGAPCELTPNPCAPGESVAATNYMSYSCLQEFTAGQRDRSRIAFDFYRTSLLEDHGNLALVPVGPPAPDFVLASQGICITAGSDIQLFDKTACIPNTFINSSESTSILFSWTMTNNNDITVTSTEHNPVFTVPADGNYDVTFTVTTSEGTNSVTKYNLIRAAGEPLMSSCLAQTTGANSYPYRTDDVGIREVSLSNLHHLSGTAVEDAVAGITGLNGYGDFSCTEMASLEPFTEYTINVLLSEYRAEHVYVYIDFDNNGITGDDLVTFADDIPGGSGIYALPPFMSPSFPIFNTRLRMRVVDADASEPPPEACGTVGYFGQIHDYSVIFNNVFPVANDDMTTVSEDHAVTLHVTGNDLDADGTLLNVVDLDPLTPLPQVQAVTSAGLWKYVVGGNVSFTPNADFNGVATVQYTILDNRYAESLPATITVTVHPVNDAPSFIKGGDQVAEDGGSQLVNGWATAISPGPPDESMQEIIFNVTNDNPALFRVQPSIGSSGDLTYTPALNVSGIATVVATLKDDGGTADGGLDTFTAQPFIIEVPLITGIEGEVVPVSVYPNPSSGEFRLHVPSAWQRSKVTVSDLLGRDLEQFVIEDEKLINLSQHGRGVYVLRVEGKNKIFTTRIMLK
ncbi:MAG: Ig-like domain-containing protein [Bacteroidota bacterium]